MVSAPSRKRTFSFIFVQCSRLIDLIFRVRIWLTKFGPFDQDQIYNRQRDYVVFYRSNIACRLIEQLAIFCSEKWEQKQDGFQPL